MADVEMSDAPTTVAKKADGAVEKKKFEVKKVYHSPCLEWDLFPLSLGRQDHADAKQWNAVALWAWDIVVDNCAICRNHIMDLCTHPTVPLSTIIHFR